MSILPFVIGIVGWTGADVRILQRVRRDAIERGRELEDVIDQYLSTVKPMHEQFIEPTKKHVDLISPERGNSVAVNLFEEKVKTEVESDGTRIWEGGAIEQEPGGRVDLDEQ